jgi:hypothetical protein
MNRKSAIATIAMMMFAGTQSLAADSVAQPTMTKRQMILKTVSCMKQRMSTDKTISYNAAAKACKDQIIGQSGNLASGTLVASDDLQKQ